jgi:Mor family transcriptional regulator
MNSPISHPLAGACRPNPPRVRSKDLVLEAIETFVSEMAKRGTPVDPVIPAAVEAEIRSTWGGQRVYVAKVAETDSHARTARDVEILLAARNGASVECLAGRYRLTGRRIRQILTGRI